MDIPVNAERADLVYKQIGDTKLMLTFLPPTKAVYEKAPLYFLIPGGGWHSEARESMLHFSARSTELLRDKGFAVATIDYRITTMSGVCMDDIVSDCFDAVRYLVHFADTLGIDKNKVITSGHSAGAHLGLMIAYAPQEMFTNDSVLTDTFKVVATAPLSPPTVLYEEDVKTLAFDTEYLFCNDSSLESRKKASPIDYVREGLPATILSAGSKDDLVFPNSSELLYEKLCKAGVRAELVMAENGGHCFEPMGDVVVSPSGEQIQEIITEFILSAI